MSENTANFSASVQWYGEKSLLFDAMTRVRDTQLLVLQSVTTESKLDGWAMVGYWDFREWTKPQVHALASVIASLHDAARDGMLPGPGRKWSTDASASLLEACRQRLEEMG